MFTTKAEIDDYLAEDSVECLECGKYFRNVGAHVRRGHHMTAREYKIDHGIPVWRGLVGTKTRKALSKNAVTMHKAGKISISAVRIDKEQNPAKYAMAMKDMVKKPPYHRRMLLEAGKKGREKQTCPPSVCEEFMRRLESGRFVTDVERDEDMPCSDVIYKRAKKDIEFAKRLKVVRNKITQAMINENLTKTTKEIAYEFLRRREKGLSISAIAKDANMPHVTSIYRYMAKDSEYANKYRAATKALRDENTKKQRETRKRCGKRRRNIDIDTVENIT